MKYSRASGILLHPTSLPGPYGIGDIGPAAHDWLEFLAESGCTLWQILPLGPTGYGDSPYQCFSAFAGNPYLISPELLLKEGLLHANDLVDAPHFTNERVDFGAVIPWKLGVLDRAYNHFEKSDSTDLKSAYNAFQAAQVSWLDDFALFMALKETHGGAAWPGWEPPLRQRNPEALHAAWQEHANAVERQKFRQFLFFRQWAELRAHAEQLGIKIIGDLPIFVAHDSADVWAHPDLFFMNNDGNPAVIAGVPPDYFSPTGQLWGNPLYRWDLHKKNGYKWWLDRLTTVLQTVDIIRMDHFRGFSGYWEVPAGMQTAEVGRWVPGPGADFFHVVKDELGELPLIAEDLGVITDDVVALRETFDLPGMKILQFAFGSGPTDKFLPHNYIQNCVVYTGTHDNDTTLGWYRDVPDSERDYCRRYLARDDQHIVWHMIRAIWASVACFSVTTMQDLLNLGTEARMNFPGKSSGNWTWRMPTGSASPELIARLKELNFVFGRAPGLEEQATKTPYE